MKKLKHVKQAMLGVFYESMGFMLQSGVNPKDCAEMLKADPSQAIKQELLDIIIDGCSDGQPLSEIVKANPILGPYWRQIAVAEQTGNLPECVSRISVQISESGDIQRKVKVAMVQPLAILAVGVGICVYLMNTVVVQIGDMMTEFGGEMPGVTLTLLRIQEHVMHFWPIDLVALAGLYFLCSYIFRGPLALALAHFVAIFKVTSGVSINSNYAVVYRLLHDMIQNGSHMVESLRIAAAACTNKYIQKELYASADEMESEGISLADALMSVKTMPPQDKMLLKVGIESSRGREILSQLAHHRTVVTSEIVNGMTDVIGPVVSVLVGLIIMVFMLGVSLPMINLTNAI